MQVGFPPNEIKVMQNAEEEDRLAQRKGVAFGRSTRALLHQVTEHGAHVELLEVRVLLARADKHDWLASLVHHRYGSAD
jgi:hypothetical protein